jgi:hypothetical protein
MAIVVKSADAVAKKWQARAQGAGGDYTNGVNQPRRPWQSSTAAAKDVYAAGVQAAIGNDSFTKGVNAAGDAKWQRKSAALGAQRYGPGITAAAPDYQANVGPFLDVIAGLNLPPRQPKGSPGNIARVQAVADALRAKKLKG